MKFKVPDKVKTQLSAWKKWAAAGTARLFSHPVWVPIVGLVAIVLGLFLARAPASDLASGGGLGFGFWVTICWLVMAIATFAAGVGIILRMASFRAHLRVAFPCSLPIVPYFLVCSVSSYFAMRTATGNDRVELAVDSAGLALVAFIFAAVSGFLFFLTRWQRLKTLPCSGKAMASQLGPVIVGATAGGIGMALAFVLWLLFRWLGDSFDVEFCREAVTTLPIETFLVVGAVPAAVFGVVRFKRGNAAGSPQAGSAAGAPASQNP